MPTYYKPILIYTFSLTISAKPVIPMISSRIRKTINVQCETPSTSKLIILPTAIPKVNTTKQNMAGLLSEGVAAPSNHMSTCARYKPIMPLMICLKFKFSTENPYSTVSVFSGIKPYPKAIGTSPIPVVINNNLWSCASFISK